MLSLAHTIISLPFGVYLHHPILIFFIAFAFHFVLDTIYHWNIDPDEYTVFPVYFVSLDIAIGLIVAWFTLDTKIISLPILAAILGGNTPDILHISWSLIRKPKNKRFPFLTYMFDFHDRIQWETKNVANGLIPQLTIVFLVILLIS